MGLTEAGSIAGARRIAEELDATGNRDRVAKAYQGFLTLNPELLDLCTAWQRRPERTEPSILGLFADLDLRADGVCSDLAASMDRFRRYRVLVAQNGDLR